MAERNEEIFSEWLVNKLSDFGPFLGMSYEGFKDEVIGLFRWIEFQRRGRGSHGRGPDSVIDKKLRMKLKRLESRVNYEKT